MSRRTSSLVRAAALAASAILAGGVPLTAAAGGSIPLTLAPADARQIALGMSMQPDRSPETYADITDELGSAPAIWSFWSDWGRLDQDGCVGGRTSLLPDERLLRRMARQGTVPIIIWQPVDSEKQDSPRYTYQRIAEGRFDCYLKRFADDVATVDGPVLIRFAHEFDGYWFPWGMGRFTNTPETFVEAWRHIWDIFRGTDGRAPNARFVWSPLGCDCPGIMEQLFPGDEYVDYLALTAFNWAGFHTNADGEPVRWQSLESIVARRLGGFSRLPYKPVIIAELGSNHRGGDKAKWIRDGYAALAERFPQVVAAIYFNVDMRTVDDPGHIENWILSMPRDGSAMRAYRALLREPRFQGVIT